MKAIALVPHTTNVKIVDWPEPQIEKPDHVKVKVLQVGVCGTDREEVAGGRADAPKGEHELIIGHEVLAEVVKVGPDVKSLKEKDLVVVIVRRPCNVCEMCKENRSDMCQSGLYTERGIKQRHGFQAEFVVDEEKYMVKVPPHLKSLAVLTEPTTVVEKAIDHSCRIQCAREPVDPDPFKWLNGKKALVAGLGPVGLLASMVLLLRGAKVVGLDRAPSNSLRPRLLEKMGGSYITGSIQGEFDIILDATGAAKLELQIVQYLAPCGIYVLTGIPENTTLSIDGGKFVSNLVLKNQVIFGSVNASRDHFKQAVIDLAAAKEKWTGVVEQFITSKTHYQQFDQVFAKRNPDEIKAVIEWEAAF